MLRELFIMISPPQSLHLQIRRPRTQTHLGSCQAVFTKSPLRGSELNQRLGFSVPFFGKFSEKSLSLHSNQMVLNIDLKGGGEERGQDERAEAQRVGMGRGSYRGDCATDRCCGKEAGAAGISELWGSGTEPCFQISSKAMHSENT